MCVCVRYCISSYCYSYSEFQFQEFLRNNVSVRLSLWGVPLQKGVIRLFQACVLRGISSLEALMKKIRAVLLLIKYR